MTRLFSRLRSYTNRSRVPTFHPRSQITPLSPPAGSVPRLGRGARRKKQRCVSSRVGGGGGKRNTKNESTTPGNACTGASGPSFRRGRRYYLRARVYACIRLYTFFRLAYTMHTLRAPASCFRVITGLHMCALLHAKSPPPPATLRESSCRCDRTYASVLLSGEHAATRLRRV